MSAAISEINDRAPQAGDLITGPVGVNARVETASLVPGSGQVAAGQFVRRVGKGRARSIGANPNDIDGNPGASNLYGAVRRVGNAPVGNVYRAGQELPVITDGEFMAMASKAVGDGDPVFVVRATGVLTNVDNAGNNVQIIGARWSSTLAAAGLASIQLGRGVIPAV